MGFILQDYSLSTCAILFIVTAFAKSYGSIYGGGSFVVQPLLMAFGIPPQVAVANDMFGSIGAQISVGLVFRKARALRMDVVKRWLLFTTLGTFAGVFLLSIIPTLILKALLLIICAIGIIYMIKPSGTLELRPVSKWSKNFAAFQIGSYLGFSGAGATTLCVAFLKKLEGLTFKQAVGTSKFLFFIPSLVAFAQYLFLGWIKPDLALLMFTACILGGWVGAHAAIRLPEKVLKITFYIAAVLVLGLASYDVLRTFRGS
tara:strand:+ start:2156 stop:2932 length:777 start_codon:yes stop_codon:yes gene_type:complete